MSLPWKDGQNSIPLPLLSLAISLGGEPGFCSVIENDVSVECLNDVVKHAATTVGFQFLSEKSEQKKKRLNEI